MIKEKSKSKVSSTTCAKALVETLCELGVNTIFGYPGAAVLSIYNELEQNRNIRHYLVRHEQAAVHAAEGFARLNEKPGTVLVTSGPGFTNTITGIANAHADSTPLVVLAGDVPTNNNKGKVFQKVDIISMTKSCSKKNFIVSSKDDIKQVIKDAYEIANSGKKGPVVIVLPRNILESKYTPKYTKILYRKKFQKISENDLKKATKLISTAQRPIILIGGGASNSVNEISEFINKTKIPVTSTLMGIGTFPSKENLYLGMVGINGTYAANTAINNSDLVIALGTSFSDRTTCKKDFFAKNAKIININIQKSYSKYDLEIISDTKTFLTEITNKLTNTNQISTWQKQVEILKKEQVSGINHSGQLLSSNILEIIYEKTKTLEPIVVTDVGQHQMLTAQYFNFNQPKKFITSGGLGTMGFGLPASIGAQIANPNALILNITGDGSFQMNLQELATCREYNIPIKIIIMNNNSLGMVRQMQEKIYNNQYQVEMTNPDFTKIAEAYDLFAIQVKTYNELVPAIEKAISYKGTAIIDISIISNEEV